ncbi:MAG: exo-alpha-sialidase [Ruminococcaceae bacterium]|nr:exo-alpha-sialidase [Oscillospiraceae bacterium]
MSVAIAKIENEVILPGRRDNRAWFEPGIAVVPVPGVVCPEVFVVAKLLTGNDVGPLFFLRTRDLGKTWTPAALSRNWHKVPLADHVFEEPWFVPFYHTKSQQLLALGNTHFVVDEGKDSGQKNEHHVRLPGRDPSAVYSLWREQQQDFLPWQRLSLPENLSLGLYYAGQKHECPDGTILVPGYYYKGPAKTSAPEHVCVTVLRLEFRDGELRFLEHGSVHVIEEKRGLAEPSLICCNGQFFLTVRHDARGYVARSDDGLEFQPLQPWLFDDGETLGNYNTQQHWLKHDNRLFLVYNRKSELNHGVFRSRAPLFVAEVDQERLCVIRDSERILIPEQRARMGNFAIADVTADESWVITGDWLEGMFSGVQPGDRFYVDSPTINYNQYIGDLLLARVIWQP